MKRLSLVLSLACLAACHKDPEPITPNEFFQKRAATECAAISPACLVPEATCIAGRVPVFAAEHQRALGELRDFHPDNAETCLDKVEKVYGAISQGAVALAGADYVAMQAVCAGVYRGTKAAFEPCLADLDCTDDLICDKGYCGTGKQVEPGAGCANIGEYCPAGSFCSNANASGVWFCSPKATAQNSCTAVPCLESLRCSSDICVPRLTTGEVCTSDNDCGTGFCEPFALRCANDLRFAPGTPVCIAMGGT